ncbi:MarR family transcriptional regulator [Vibrio sp. CAU 1672]|uniref:MarR family transcriptional regulator n=1 Tax=Vibrio sp. CAU 1672 TaxID=3032594 RepID=UPI0023DC251B|nr:MarR family transcriptional regulator [Vibrio sp. CAU 1672]MDF2153804.1 MarR family transcriptional regulator [Vibrio sp. CAU 1672]
MIQSVDMLRELSLAEQLARVARLWKMVADRELAPLGLTHPRWTALWKLQRLGDHVSQKTLAEALEIELASLMRTLKQLEEQSLITRKGCEEDKRVRIVSLTPAGNALLEQMEDKILQVRRTLLADIDESQLEVIRTALGQMAHNALDALND